MQKKFFPRACVLFFFFASAGLYALGSGEKQENEARQEIKEYRLEISGILRLVGNEPFARLVVSTPEGKDYIIDNDSPARKALHSLQNRRIHVDASVKEYPVYAGKKYLGQEFVIVPLHYDLEPEK